MIKTIQKLIKRLFGKARQQDAMVAGEDLLMSIPLSPEVNVFGQRLSEESAPSEMPKTIT